MTLEGEPLPTRPDVLAVVGSRSFDDEPMVYWAIAARNPHTVISGGAAGADTLAEKVARELGVHFVAMLPDWKRYGRSAGFRRNEDIVRHATHVLAFFAPGPPTPGTSHTVRLAREAGLPVEVYHEGRWSR